MWISVCCIRVAWSAAGCLQKHTEKSTLLFPLGNRPTTASSLVVFTHAFTRTCSTSLVRYLIQFLLSQVKATLWQSFQHSIIKISSFGAKHIHEMKLERTWSMLKRCPWIYHTAIYSVSVRIVFQALSVFWQQPLPLPQPPLLQTLPQSLPPNLASYCLILPQSIQSIHYFEYLPCTQHLSLLCLSWEKNDHWVNNLCDCWKQLDPVLIQSLLWTTRRGQSTLCNIPVVPHSRVTPRSLPLCVRLSPEESISRREISTQNKAKPRRNLMCQWKKNIV